MTTPPAAPALHTIPVILRPPKTWAQTANRAGFALVFNLGAGMIHLVQLCVLLPLAIIGAVLPGGRGRWVRGVYEDGARYCKGACATLLVLATQWFAPTTLRLTFETTGQGALSPAQLADLVVRDASGRVIKLNLPQQSVMISNHQVYADWWYAWCFTYFCDTHRDVIIVLKKSLKWVPFLGWAMQFFSFIFLARSWASDRAQLASALAAAAGPPAPLALLLYPEGTLVSPHTRPVSARYAAQHGLAHPAHVLLPRATGLHYSLRALVGGGARALSLVDLTIVYPGVPAAGGSEREEDYAQGYYTLRSIFFDRVPPPVVHIHVRVFDVVREVPIGEMGGGDAPAATLEPAAEVEFSESERAAFDVWLRQLWTDKDALIARFLATGSFGPAADATRVDVPVQLKTRREALDAFAFFVPGVVGVVWARMKHLL
ncbi:hypothetical protein FIBSPDRAFT_722715 [Athelia psychrophila]|uniref:Phospholipid/glycerol acyltransferase domain-containing protein n=1 Tax=Athelia psychrophila TaxID=1759441 RepID=A0A166V4R4_9AGAM|nr:hypothetical protein FIBSPDRAFT_722715 [Fibularhizoctonia sp. CBS 109695]